MLPCAARSVAADAQSGLNQCQICCVGQDVILIRLNPIASFLTSPTAVTLSAFSYDTADTNVAGTDIVRLTVAQLRNPTTIDSETLLRLQRAWDSSGLGGLNDAANSAASMGRNREPAQADSRSPACSRTDNRQFAQGPLLHPLSSEDSFSSKKPNEERNTFASQE